MDLQPDDLKELIGMTLGMLVVLIPVTGFTIRFAAKPLVDALVQSGLLARPAERASEADVARLQRRVLELEQQVAKLRTSESLASLDAELPDALRRVRS